MEDTEGRRKRKWVGDEAAHRPTAGEEASSCWTLKIPRPLAVLMRDLCERLQVEHFITVRSLLEGGTIDLRAQWTIETSDEKHAVMPRWMNQPELLQPEANGELMVTMHTHPRAAITHELDWVHNLRRRHQHAKTKPLLYVPSTADVNNMLQYGMHVHIVVTPFHWFVCHVPQPSEPTPLKWDMPTLLTESESHHRTPADWAAAMNARCDNFCVAVLACDRLNFDYSSTASALSCVHYDASHMWIELDFALVKAGLPVEDAYAATNAGGKAEEAEEAAAAAEAVSEPANLATMAVVEAECEQPAIGHSTDAAATAVEREQPAIRQSTDAADAATTAAADGGAATTAEAAAADGTKDEAADDDDAAGAAVPVALTNTDASTDAAIKKSIDIGDVPTAAPSAVETISADAEPTTAAAAATTTIALSSTTGVVVKPTTPSREGKQEQEDASVRQTAATEPVATAGNSTAAHATRSEQEEGATPPAVTRSKTV